MNEKLKIIICYFLIGITIFLLGAVGGYHFSEGNRSNEITNLTEKLDATIRERDATVNRITENNKRLSDGIKRLEDRLRISEARVDELVEYNHSASERNQQVITDVGGTRQNLEEASGIIGHYLNEE